MIGDHVIINGSCLMGSSRDKWRFGVIKEVIGNSLVLVECQPRFKERKTRRIICSITWLLKDITTVREKMRNSGLSIYVPLEL